jgi:malate permease and related proteins
MAQPRSNPVQRGYRPMTQVLPVIPILLLFVLGFLLQKARFFREDSVPYIKRIVTDLALPSLLFRAFSSLVIESRYLVVIPVVFATCGTMVLLGKFIARLLRIKTPYFPIMMGGFEMGMFGYALFIAFYGQEQLGKAAFIALGQVLFVFTVLITMLIQVREGRQTTWSLFSRFFTSPIILGALAGIVARVLRPSITIGPFMQTIGTLIGLLGGLTVPLIAITIGYGIRIKRTGLWLSIVTIVTRKSLLLVFALLINRYVIDGLLHMESIYRYALLVMCLTPPPFIISILVRDDEFGSSDYASNTISLDCIISVLLGMVAAGVYR